MSASITQNLASGAEAIPIDIVSGSIQKVLSTRFPETEISLLIVIQALLAVIIIRSIIMYVVYSRSRITKTGIVFISNSYATTFKVLFMIALCAVFVTIRLLMSISTNIIFSSPLPFYHYIGIAAFGFCTFIPMTTKFMKV